MAADPDPMRDESVIAPDAGAPPDTLAPPVAEAAPDAGTRPAPDALRRRPLIERLGLAVFAVALGALFAVVGVASFVGGEPFLGVMGLIGCLMVLWVGGLTLFRG